MAKLGKVTFSNSHAAVADQFTFTDSQVDDTQTINLLSQGDPGSASLYSIGLTGGGTTTLPLGTSSSIAIPTDLLDQDSNGSSVTTTQGATVTIQDASKGIVTVTASGALQHAVDELAAGHTLSDSFLYAIKMADGTVSWNTVNFTWVGEAANITVDETNGGVQEDVNGGTTVHNILTDTVDVTATAASGDATGFTIAADAGDWGTLSGYSGSGDVQFTYSVTDDYIYNHSSAGYGEVAHTDSFTVTTDNGTTETFTEMILGNIHAATFTTALSGADEINEGDSVALNIAATDHDDNASLTYTISGLDGATLNHGTYNSQTDSWSLSGADLNGLVLTTHEGEEGALDVHVTVTNTETDLSDNSMTSLDTSTDINLIIDELATAPNLSASAAQTWVNEGGSVALNISASAAEDDQNAPSILISGVTGGASLSAGHDNGDGTWTLSTDELANLTLTAGAEQEGSLNLTVTATDTEAHSTATSASQSINLTIAEQADAPNLSASTTLSGAANTAISLGISASAFETDQNGNVTVTISGIPAGATLSDSNNDTLTINNGSITLTLDELAGLTLTDPNPGSATLHVTATDTEAHSTASGSADISLTVTNPDVEGPVSFAFGMDLAELQHLIGPSTGNQNNLNPNTGLGAVTASGDPDDTFTYSLGTGTDGQGHTFDGTAHFSIDTTTGLLSTGGAAVQAGTYYLDAVATDSDNPANASHHEYVVYVGTTGNDAPNFSGTNGTVIAYGLQGSDTLTGSYLSGGNGNDLLSAVGGTLVGNAGADTLTHITGTGSVTFAYLSANDSQWTKSGSSFVDNVDTINDFISGADHIDFSQVSGLDSQAHFNTLTSAPTTIAADTIDIVEFADHVEVYANTGSVVAAPNTSSSHTTDGDAVLEIDVAGINSLSSSDFHLHA